MLNRFRGKWEVHYRQADENHSPERIYHRRACNVSADNIQEFGGLRESSRNGTPEVRNRPSGSHQ